MNSRTTRYYDIDILRFLAAIAVMLMHYTVRGFSKTDTYYQGVFYGASALVFKYNWFAVNLFFAISGFVILMSAAGGDYKKFLISRVTRLYPAYWMCCCISFFIGYFYVNDIMRLTWARFIINMTMLNGLIGVGFVDGVYWTLWVEMRFYMLVFLLLYMKRDIMPALIAWLIISVIQLNADNNFLDEMLAARYAPFFVFGCAMYRISINGYSFRRSTLAVCAVVVGAMHEVKHLAQP